MILETALNFIGGPIMGIIGGAVTSFVTYKTKRLEMEENNAKRTHELALYEMNLRARGQEMEHEVSLAELKAIGEMRTASYEHDQSYGKPSSWATDALRLFRPGITMMLIVLTGLFYFYSPEVTVGDYNLRVAVVQGTMNYLGMAISWWFGDRMVSKMQAGPRIGRE